MTTTEIPTTTTQKENTIMSTTLTAAEREAIITQPRKLNGSKLVRTIRKLARQRPEHVAECRYIARDGVTPQCIVGVALRELDAVPAQQLSYMGSFGNHVDEGTLIVSKRYAHWISEVQAEQDCRRPWAEAVKAADELHGRVW